MADFPAVALEITDERVAAAAGRLHDGGWAFSARQLYYAVCADAEVPRVRVASGEIGLGLVLVLVGVIIGQRIVLFVVGGIGLLLVGLGAVTHIAERRPEPLTRVLAISFAEFTQGFLGQGRTYDGMVDIHAPAASEEATLIVCDRDDTAAVLAANRERIGEVAICTASGRPDNLRGRRVVCVHDCDPAGCGLVADLVDAGAEVVDAGINPREIAGRRVQLLEGAPARLPRDLTGRLEEPEIDWLRSGRRLEIATEPPEALVTRVRGALG